MPAIKAHAGTQGLPLGDFDLLTGDFKTPGSLQHIGMLDGDAGESAPWTVEHFTAEQYTGMVPHRATARMGEVTLNINVIGGEAGILAKLSAVGTKHVGGRRRRPVTETSAWIVPRALLDAFPAGITYDGVAWNPAGVATDLNLENAALYPRCYFRTNGIPRPFSRAGLSVVPVTLVAMVDFTAPQGAIDALADVICRGNPATLYPLFRVGS